MAALISYSMAASVGSPKFIYVDINLSDYLDQRITYPFFQINSPYLICYINFFLPLTLHYNIKFSQILIQI